MVLFPRRFFAFAAALFAALATTPTIATASDTLVDGYGTAFLVVAAPEPDALREAAYFVERLTEDEMPLAGLVVNRASPPLAVDLSVEEATAAADRLVGVEADSTTAGLLRLHADRARIVAREAHLRSRWATEHPGVASAVVPALSTDVHDLDGLRRVGALLAGE